MAAKRAKHRERMAAIRDVLLSFWLFSHCLDRDCFEMNEEICMGWTERKSQAGEKFLTKKTKQKLFASYLYEFGGSTLNARCGHCEINLLSGLGIEWSRSNDRSIDHKTWTRDFLQRCFDVSFHLESTTGICFEYWLACDDRGLYWDLPQYRQRPFTVRARQVEQPISSTVLFRHMPYGRCAHSSIRWLLTHCHRKKLIMVA